MRPADVERWALEADCTALQAWTLAQRVAGRSDAEIAAERGVSRRAVRKVAQAGRWRLAKHHSTSLPDPRSGGLERREQIVRLVEARHSDSWIAATVGVSREYVGRVRRTYTGLPPGRVVWCERRAIRREVRALAGTSVPQTR